MGYNSPNDSGIAVEKQNLRRIYKKRALDIPSSLRKEGSKDLANQIKDFLNDQKITEGLWGSYFPMIEEIHPPTEAYKSLKWAYPKIEGDGMDFYFFDGEVKIIPHSIGFNEPDMSVAKRVTKDSLVGIFIPAIAYDLKGYRLGRGRAFYDFFLEDFKGLKVGVCFEEQLHLDPLPTHKWDVKMDFIVTNKRIISCEVS